MAGIAFGAAAALVLVAVLAVFLRSMKDDNDEN